MKILRSSTYLPLLCGAFLLGAKAPAAQARPDPYYRYYRDAIRDDLLAIPAGTPATDEQKQVLSNDLNRLFPNVYPLPAVTIDFLAERLAEVASAGHLASEKAQVVAKRLVFLLQLSGTTAEQFDDFQTLLAKGGAGPTETKPILDAVKALQYSYTYDNTSVGLSNDLRVIHPEAADYKRANGSVGLTTSVRPVFDDYGIVTAPASVQHGLDVRVDKLPAGKYRVSVTAGSDGTITELGTLGVHKRRPTVITDDGTVVPGSVKGYGSVTFSDGGYRQPLPAGLPLDQITAVTITDAQGAPQFTGSLLGGPLGAATTQSADLRLRADVTAPTVGGILSFDNFPGYNPDRHFTLEAVGMPANATLTLSVNGKAVGPVATGPTGNLYVKEYNSIFRSAPEPMETVNLLPDAVDLSTAKTFTLSDAQGAVLATAGE